MQLIFGMFSKYFNSKGWNTWDTTLKNISDIHHMYGMTNAKRRKQLIDKFSHIHSSMMRCTIDK